MAERVEVEGARELARTFRQLGLDLKDLREANKEAAEPVAEQARRLSPSLTGAFEGSIRTGGQQASATVIGGGARAMHFPYVHFGVPALGMAPRPVLYDALDDRADEILRVYERVVDRLIAQHDLT